MKIVRRQSNFAQFSDDLWLRVSHDNTVMNVDINQEELLGFAYMMIDIADDALNRSKHPQSDDIRHDLGEVMGRLYDIGGPQ